MVYGNILEISSNKKCVVKNKSCVSPKITTEYSLVEEMFKMSKYLLEITDLYLTFPIVAFW